MRLKHPAISPSALEASARFTPAELVVGYEPHAPAASECPQPTEARAVEAPPQLTGGEHQGDAPEFAELILQDGTVKAVLKRSGPDGCGFIDWLNFTFSESTAHRLDWPCTLSDADIVNAVSATLVKIFGFGVTGSDVGRRNFYQRAFPLGDGYGFICHGGQRETVLVMISGDGLTAARPGWEGRLRHFLEHVAISPRLTRVDVAYDCFAGEYSVDQADSDFDAGLFRLSRSPKNPTHELRGNWREPDGKGRTIYIGRRVNGKFCRVYEKGRQLGCPSSNWTRIEVEYKSVDRVIPFDILTSPGAFLSGAYPAFGWISEKQDRIRTTREEVLHSKERKENWIKLMCGADLNALHFLEKGRNAAEKALNLINRLKNETKLPAWTIVPSFEHCTKSFILGKSDVSAAFGVFE